MKRGARIMLDSFSGPAADLPVRQRTADGVLAALRKNPRVSTWDMEQAWLRSRLRELQDRGDIREHKAEPYPWHRYIVLKPAEAQS